MRKAETQVSVPMSKALREFLERTAAEENRSVSGQVRHLLEQVARTARAEQPQAA
jgi:hypothetical protein